MPVPVMTIDGDVIAVTSHWTDDESRIVTEATVRTADGDVVVNQMGGTVDGIGMVQMPGPTILEVGMHVAVAAHKGMDELQQEHVVLDSVRVVDYLPGYVRTTGMARHQPLYWASGCAYVTVDSAGTSAIPGDGEFAIIDAAINEWNTKTASCSDFKIVNAGRKAGEVGKDSVNLIKFRDTPCACPTGGTSWGCRPAVGKDPAHCYSSQAAGITTAAFIDDPTSKRDGEILDADIELNGVDFAISAAGQTTSTAPCRAELQNTLTHELGHLHGLEHTCYLGDNPGWTDNLGNPVPACSPVNPTAIQEATMYPTQDCGETKKESLSPDDIQAMCDIYPKTASPKACEPVGQTGGCCSASAAGSDVSLLLGGATMVLVLRRRRARRA